jgi:hypothetical protein
MAIRTHYPTGRPELTMPADDRAAHGIAVAPIHSRTPHFQVRSIRDKVSGKTKVVHAGEALPKP